MEGTSARYGTQKGSSSFKWAAQNKQPWAYAGSDLTAVMNGAGHTIWSFADATPPGPDGYQVVAVDPRVVRARSGSEICSMAFSTSMWWAGPSAAIRAW